MTSKVSRRNFLKVAGLAAAGAGVTACAPQQVTVVVTQQVEKQVEVTKEVVKEVQVTVAPVKPSGKIIHIRVHDFVADDATGALAYPRYQQQEWADLFPNIEVTHLPFPSVTVEKRKEYWTTALSADSGGPSAVRFDASQFTIEMASIGLAAPLDDYIAKYFPDWKDVAPIVQDISKYQGKIYQIPSMTEGVGYVVRRDYLEEVGLGKDYEPKDWTEWQNMCMKLTNDKHQGVMWNWMLGQFMAYNGGTNAMEKDDRTITLTYTAEQNQEAIRLLHGLIHPTNYTDKDPFADFGTLLNDFQQGNLSVFPFYPSWLNWLFGTAKFQPEDLSFFAYPLGPSAVANKTLIKPWAWISCWSWMLGKHQPEEEADAAAHYICWLNSVEQIKKQAQWWKDNELKGVFPSPFMSVPWTDVSTGVPEWWKATWTKILSMGGVSPAPDFRGGTYWDKGIDKIMHDPSQSAIQGYLQEAEDITKREWLDQYHKSLTTPTTG